MKKYSQIKEPEENLGTFPSLNLNDYIYVQLSREGEKFFKSRYLQSCKEAKIDPKNAKEMLDRLCHGEYWEFQFHEFIDAYSAYTYQTKRGIDTFVKDMNVFLSKITQRGERVAKNTGIS